MSAAQHELEATAPSRGAALGLALVPFALAALGSLIDITTRPRSVEPTMALAFGALWLGLALPFSFLTAVFSLVAPRLPLRVPVHARLLAFAWALAQLSVLAALITGLVGVGSAALLSALAMAGLIRGMRSPSAVAWLARAAAVVASLSLPLAAAAPLLAHAGMPERVLRLSLLALLTLAITLAARVRTGVIALVTATVMTLAVLGAYVGTSSGVARSTPASHKRSATPNVVLIVLDTLRADHLGFHGRTPSITPHLDALAARSTVYTNCFATAGWTVPSHASLFTGLYPTTHGTSFEHHRWLEDRFTTLAEALRARGYRTSAFASNVWLNLTNELQGFDTKVLLSSVQGHLHVKPVLQLLGFPSRFMDHGAAEAVARLERYLRNVPDDGRPQFVFVNLLEPHWQYLPPLAERLAALPPGLGVVSATRISSTFDPPIAMATKQTDPMTQTAVRALYAAGVRYEDERFAELLDALDRRLDPENTLLIVTADHGENLGEGGRYDHVFALNDHLIHVPLLLRYPKQIPSGREDGLCSQLDVSATLQDVVPGLSLSPSSDVRSLLPGKFTARSLVFAAGDPYLGHLAPMADSVPLREDVAHYNRVLRAVRGPRFKYVESSQDAPVLYDMEKDPNELKDVSAENPGVADALRRQLRAWEAREPRYEDAGGATDRRAVGAKAGDALEALRALGYVQ